MAYSVHKNRKRRGVAAFGAILLVFSFIGICSVGYLVFNHFFGGPAGEEIRNPAEIARVEAFLTPIVMTDPAPFSNPAALTNENRLKISVWFAMNYEVGFLDEIDFDEVGRMIIREDLVRRSHLRLFGTGAPAPVMQSFSYGDDVFEYDVVSQIFRVPLIGLANVYSPRISSLIRSGNNLYATVDFIDPAHEEITQYTPASHSMIFTLTGPRGNEVIQSVSRN